ncbi:MAG: SDR family oxidoreductase, partial [Sinomonas sp.]|nr:SDR family oxidoreductase [Sinomonas sp.]
MNTQNTAARRPSVVVVTGAANGIGRATSDMLVDDGHIVIGIDKDLRAPRHPRLRMLTGDVADVSILRDAAELAASFGDVVGWVNNVGVGCWKLPCEFEATDLKRVLDVNLLSIMMGTSVAADVLVPGSSVVNMSSIHAARAFQAGSVYAGTKAAIEAFSRGAARDLAPTLRVNVIRP